MITQGLAPGIYFDLPEEVYFADKALSRSDMLHLLDTPNTYWKNSWMNSERSKIKSSKEMDYGSAFDYMLFTPKLFEKKYQVVPVDVWDNAKKKISLEDYYKIIDSIKVLKAGHESGMYLRGGIPQVTIVFEHSGVRYRVRIDLFKPMLSLDYKTIWSLNERHLKRAFEEYGYDIQMRLYRWARQRFKEQFKAGEAHVYGKVDPKFFRQFMDDELNEFVFLFQRSSAPYPYLPLITEDDTEDHGAQRITDASLIYQKNLELYGTKEWPVCEGKTKAFSITYGIRE